MSTPYKNSQGSPFGDSMSRSERMGNIKSKTFVPRGFSAEKQSRVETNKSTARTKALTGKILEGTRYKRQELKKHGEEVYKSNRSVDKHRIKKGGY